MVNLCLLILVVFYFTQAQSQSYPSKNQNVTIKRLTTFVSNYFAYSQYQAIMNTLSSDVYNEESFDQIKSDAENEVMAQLTSSQYTAIMGKATTLILKMGASGATTALNKAITVLSNNLMPFFDQLQGYAKYLKNRGLKEQGVVKNGYRIVNSFASKKRIKTIFTRVSLQFSASDWKSIVSALTGILNFSKNGF